MLYLTRWGAELFCHEYDLMNKQQYVVTNDISNAAKYFVKSPSKEITIVVTLTLPSSSYDYFEMHCQCLYPSHRGAPCRHILAVNNHLGISLLRVEQFNCFYHLDTFISSINYITGSEFTMPKFGIFQSSKFYHILIFR